MLLSRILLPIKRFFVPVSKASSSIPTLTGRQFIVSKMDDAHEKATRELFWYREELLERLKATWKEVSTIPSHVDIVHTTTKFLGIWFKARGA